MEKTLYLNENTSLDIIRDGPSIVVKENGKSGRRVPARLVQRVVIIGNMKLETGLITLFTQNNIPVTFLDKRGSQIAVTLPCKHRLPEYYLEQKILLESDYTTRRFMTFLKAYRQRIQIDVLKRMLKRHLPERYITEGLREEEYRQVIDEAIMPYSERFSQIRNAVSAIFLEMVVSKLVASDLDPHLGVMHRRQDFGLALDICHILGPEIDIQSIQFFNGKKVSDHCIQKVLSPEDMRVVAVRFENRREYLANMTDRIIDGIFELIRELRISGEYNQI